MTIKNFFKHPIKESLRNLWFFIGSRYRYFTGEINQFGAVPPDGYEIVWEDAFNKPGVNQERWRFGQPWGDFHSGDLDQYYGTEGQLAYVSHDGLVLELRHKPKTYIKRDLPEWRRTPEMPDEFTIPYGIGLVTSRVGWQYGWFEAEIKLPDGKYHWPAFWLTGENSWPPEIDIFEAYSREIPAYSKRGLRNWVIQPNLHYGSTELGTKEMYGPYNCPVLDADKRFVKYACWWEKDFIRIYYDGYLVFECTDPKVLANFNGDNDSQIMVINHGVNTKSPDETPTESAVVIRSVRVYQKK